MAALTGAAIILGARLTVLDIRLLRDADDEVLHTRQVLQSTQALLESVLDAESGARGFLITDDERYLRRYEDGALRARSHLAHLGELTQAPTRRREVEGVATLLPEALAHLERAVELRRTEGFAAARAFMLSAEGQGYVDRLRASAATIAADERSLLQERSRVSAAAARRARVTTIIVSAVSLALLALAVELARRWARERAAATARAHAEAQRLRITLTSVGDGVVVTDERGAVTMLNPIAARLMQCGDEILGRPLDSAFRLENEETRRPVESPVRTVLREGRPAGLANHTVLMRPDGDAVPIDDSAAPILGADGGIVGVVLVFRDIRERRESERARERASQQLKERDEHKDRFLALLAHELRNPLSPMRSAVSVLRHDRALPAQRGRAIAALDRQLAHLTRLVDDLLDVARIAQGRIHLRREHVDVAEVVRRTVADLHDLFTTKRIALELRDPRARLWVDADPTRLSQVTGNLLQNAAKFTDPGGRVVVRVARDSDRAVLEVRDTGEGMDAATLAHLFHPFAQAERTLHRSASGLGLGLALSKSIVELHGGSVRASSPGIGKGAVFAVELPLATAPTAGRSEEAPPTPTAPRRVLVIDDNEDAAITLRDVLVLERHEVFIAHDAESGVAALLREQPDLVLCDVGLPGADGYEVARRARAAGSRATLVALTGYAAAEDVQRARDAGFDRHLAKPVDVQTLQDVLAKARPSDVPRQGASAILGGLGSS